MAALQIRSVPEDLHEWLAVDARKKHRSMNQQALIYLRFIQQHEDIAKTINDTHDGVPTTRSLFGWESTQEEIERNKARRRAAIEATRNLEPIRIPEGFPTPAEMIREDRDR